MENKDLSIRKIPLNDFINVLVEIYNKGVEYVDLEGMQGETIDEVSISFTKDYMIEEAQKNFEDCEIEEEELNKKLSDKDIDQLL